VVTAQSNRPDLTRQLTYLHHTYACLRSPKTSYSKICVLSVIRIWSRGGNISALGFKDAFHKELTVCLIVPDVRIRQQRVLSNHLDATICMSKKSRLHQPLPETPYAPTRKEYSTGLPSDQTIALLA
jgi:hypothetical protein